MLEDLAPELYILFVVYKVAEGFFLEKKKLILFLIEILSTIIL